MSTNRRRREPRIAWPVAVLAALGVGAALYAGYNEATGGGGEQPPPGADAASTTTPVTAKPVTRTASKEVGPADRSWSFDPFPGSYEITFLVSFVDSTNTEVLRVSAPFDSRTESRRGRTPDGALTDEREFAFGLLATRAGDANPVVLQVPPALAGARPAAAIVVAEQDGLVQRREVREVAGRRCQVWRTSSEVAATTYLPPDPKEYIDLCIDRTGVLLEEWQVSDGRAIRQRVATAVRFGPVDPAALQQLPREVTLAASMGGGSTRQTEPTAQPIGPFLETTPATAPEGFTLRGRFTVVPPQSGLVDESRRGKVTASTTDVYVRGIDAIVIERGGVLDLSDPWRPDDRFVDVDLGPAVGTGERLAGTAGAEVRALLGSGRFLRVYGSVDTDTLAAVARSLVKVENGTGLGFGD